LKSIKILVNISFISETRRGFEQAYNAQTGVDTESMMIVASHVSQQTNDKQ
jgi:hypothetical protein